MKPVKAVVFDFDGVLVDSERYWVPLENEEYSKVVPFWKQVDSDRIMGLDFEGLYRFLKEERNLELSKEKMRSIYERIGKENYRSHCSLMEGALELIAALREREIPLGIGTSCKRAWIEIALRRLNVLDAFPLIVTSDELPRGKGKPDPLVYLLVAQELRVPPEDCLVIEDSENGIRAAKGAGMKCIALRSEWNKKQDLSKADGAVRSLRELSVESILS